MEEISFEARIDKAKEILGKLNAQNLNLKEGLSLYKEGMEELELAQKMLEEAKLEYQELKSNNAQAKEKE
ncbi:exodeoxyribonuclease VII small subunit [Helicobacter sp. 12S02232-10]|uniref:exodeoxyribonuclease VII small subunit n=1 Tax=Helicobacter sp. 12S02232-10 TaxID=1476197 RepID=UPI000BA66633|nr:exodeoxyribonuclease VII small subunit [Helicobacter sp. 12S02232-10]PAF48232.1 exodeoxyribonuclease VII small subunit [Helicobacter sp. 12S02232-10]